MRLWGPFFRDWMLDQVYSQLHGNSERAAMAAVPNQGQLRDTKGIILGSSFLVFSALANKQAQIDREY